MNFHCGKIAGTAFSTRSFLINSETLDLFSACFGSKRSRVRITSPRPFYLTRNIDVSLGKDILGVSQDTPVNHGYLGYFRASSGGKLGDGPNLIQGRSSHMFRSGTDSARWPYSSSFIIGFSAQKFNTVPDHT